MGTRRSRHNKGRKPLYKEHRRHLIDGEQPARRLSRRTRGNREASPAPDGFLLSEAARLLTREAVSKLSEDAALDLFKQLRWADTNGEPVCANCQSPSHYVTARQRFVCKECREHYTVTTGTIFASRKLSYRSILISIAVFLKNDDRKTLEDRADLIDCNPRTAYSLTERFRQALEAEGDEIRIGRSRYGGLWLRTGAHWTAEEKAALTSFAAKKAALSDAADALGRSPSSLLGYSRELSIRIPVLWMPPRRSGPAPLLHYPFVREARPENADLLEINHLVPQALGGESRADICQEIMLALLEGRTSIAELKAHSGNTHFFVKKFYRDNFEQAGRAVSFSAFDDERAYDEIASSIAAREWRETEMNEARRAFDSMQSFSAPHQMGDLFTIEALEHQVVLHRRGEHVSYDEAAADISEEDWTRNGGERVSPFEREIFARPSRLELRHKWRAIRAWLWREQKARCSYCKCLTRLPEQAEPAWLPVATVEHLNPVSRGGKRFDRENLIMACERCNGAKSDLTADEFRALPDMNP